MMSNDKGMERWPNGNDASERNIKMACEKAVELSKSSTRVVGWYAHRYGDDRASGRATVRGPFFRWFELSPGDDRGQKALADVGDDVEFCAFAMNNVASIAQAYLELQAANEERRAHAVEVERVEGEFRREQTRREELQFDFDAKRSLAIALVNEKEKTLGREHELSRIIDAEREARAKAEAKAEELRGALEEWKMDLRSLEKDFAAEREARAQSEDNFKALHHVLSAERERNDKLAIMNSEALAKQHAKLAAERERVMKLREALTKCAKAADRYESGIMEGNRVFSPVDIAAIASMALTETSPQ